jgi:hypothetical protein
MSDIVQDLSDILKELLGQVGADAPLLDELTTFVRPVSMGLRAT